MSWLTAPGGSAIKLGFATLAIGGTRYPAFTTTILKLVGSRPSEVKSLSSWKGRRRAVSTNEIPLTSTTAWRSGKSEVGNRKMTFAGTSTGWLASGSSVAPTRSEEHTSELQSRQYLVCRLLLEKKKTIKI